MQFPKFDFSLEKKPYIAPVRIETDDIGGSRNLKEKTGSSRPSATAPRSDKASRSGSEGPDVHTRTSVFLEKLCSSVTDDGEVTDYETTERRYWRHPLRRATIWNELGEDLDMIHTRRAEIRQSLKSNPYQIDAWLYLERLESAVALEKSGSSTSIVQEISISVIEEALRHNPNSFRLHKELSRYLPLKSVPSYWKHKAITFKNPEFFSEWCHSVFYTNTDGGFIDVFDGLIAEGILKEANLAGERQHIDVLYALSSLLRDAGYIERAIGIWQALVEFNRFASMDNSISSFETYWNSECSRFGDEAPIHWNAFDCQSFVPSISTEYLIPRSFSLSESDDAYSVVLWDDIKHFVTNVPIDSGFLSSMFAFFGAKTNRRDPGIYGYEQTVSKNTIARMIGQMFQADASLPLDYLAWSFDFMSSFENYFQRYTHAVLKKHPAKELFVEYAKSVLSIGDKNKGTAVFTRYQNDCHSWSQWVIASCHSGCLTEEMVAKMISSFEKSSGVFDENPLASFLHSFLLATGQTSSKGHALLATAFEDYWAQNSSSTDEMNDITTVLVSPYSRKLGFDVWAQVHLIRCSERITVLDYKLVTYMLRHMDGFDRLEMTFPHVDQSCRNMLDILLFHRPPYEDCEDGNIWTACFKVLARQQYSKVFESAGGIQKALEKCKYHVQLRVIIMKCLALEASAAASLKRAAIGEAIRIPPSLRNFYFSNSSIET